MLWACNINRPKVKEHNPERGDPANSAKRAVLEKHAPELFRFLARRLRSRLDAEDLLQSVYLRFLQTPHTELIRQPRAYLYRIATNVIGEFHLRRRREPVLYDSNTASEVAERSEGVDIWTDTFGDRMAIEEQVARVLNQIPKTYRAVLLMRTRDGLSFEEIARRFGISEQTARKYMVRAMALCRTVKWNDT
jgi:RNA polymerase sigma-70 factor (ECF subfamily)